VEIVSYDGPRALRLRETELPQGVPAEIAAFGEPVRIAVRAAGVSFPELLQSRGQYQMKPELPFVPGAEVAGTVEQAPCGSSFAPGDRVFAFCLLGGFADTALAPEQLVFRLPESLDFAEGASLFSNYHTAYFSLVTRGRAERGETVLVHGAAGGVGTASLQVARALGLKTIAAAAGAMLVLRSDGPWKDEALAAGGADMVLDPVGDRTLDSLRALREGGRLVIVGFTSGEIPEIAVHRPLHRNVDVIGAGYGAYVFSRPELGAAISSELGAMIDQGLVRPIVGARYSLSEAGAALAHLDSRRALGKVVLEVDG
jgi:NADPH:quinone reductase